MPPTLIPAVAMLAGAATGIRVASPSSLWLLIAAVAAALFIAAAWRGHRSTLRPFLAVATFCVAAALASAASAKALSPSLRQALDARFGGFAIDSIGPAGAHDPIATRVELLEDAVGAGSFVSLRGQARALRLAGEWRSVTGGLTISVGGTVPIDRVDEWRAGRVIEVPLVYRRPARYRNEGVPDLERDLALDGTALFASAKSGLIVDVVQRGSWMAEQAARFRRDVRQALARHVGSHSTLSAAIVTAVLIGDRTGLPDVIRTRLQAAGTYHVIAISGGNIAILALLAGGGLLLTGVSPRGAAAGTLTLLLAYAFVVTAGPSVWRAVLMAAIYLMARLVDHRTPPWHAVALAAMVVMAWHPLDVRDAGFLLTFGATAALLETARRCGPTTSVGSWRRWLATSLLASLAVEVALLPIAATTFSRVTGAGLLLNLIAVPAMATAQVAGLVVVSLPGIESAAAVAGWIAHGAALVLVESARLVDAAPWLTARVPPPAAVIVCSYYASLGVALLRRGRARAIAFVIWSAAASAIVLGLDPYSSKRPAAAPGLRLTMFDVGQGESMLLELPDGSRILIDSGGAPFGGGGFDIGGRVLAPALWARGIRRLDALVLTHGDPDHRGGAVSVLSDFSPRRFLQGIPVAAHVPLAELERLALKGGASVEWLRTGHESTAGGARVRVLHPPDPDWERPRVRNDDSVVLEVAYRDVVLLLTGDVSAEVERAIIPMLTPAKVRVLKVAHHGSRTSTSRELLEAWRPSVALISAGRGNTFGHPAPEVIERLTATGAQIYRTDRHGQITLASDGQTVRVTTFTGAEP